MRLKTYRWVWCAILPLIFNVSCLTSSFTSVPSVPSVPSNVKYSQELASNENLKKHSDYFLKAYAGTTKDEAVLAYGSILKGEILTILYDVSIRACETDTTNNFLNSIPTIKGVLLQHLSFYSDTWSTAISNHAKYECCFVDFSTALLINKHEYKRMGIFDKVEKIQGLIKSRVSLYERDKFPRTYEVYGLITQLISLCEDPKGSLMSFNQTINSIDIELEKILALAELEH